MELDAEAILLAITTLVVPQRLDDRARLVFSIDMMPVHPSVISSTCRNAQLLCLEIKHTLRQTESQVLSAAFMVYGALVASNGK